jgi:hypothetical protein
VSFGYPFEAFEVVRQVPYQRIVFAYHAAVGYGYYYGESHFGVMIFIFEWQRYKNLMVLCGIVGGLNVYANI